MGTLPEIDWDHFAAVEMRVGHLVEVEERGKSAWKLRIDFGPEVGLGPRRLAGLERRVDCD